MLYPQLRQWKWPGLYFIVIFFYSLIIVLNIIRKMFSEDKTPSEVSEELANLSIQLGSSDNVTIVTVRFLHNKE